MRRSSASTLARHAFDAVSVALRIDSAQRANQRRARDAGRTGARRPGLDDTAEDGGGDLGAANLEIVGLTLAGGILLLWVTHKMWRETRAGVSSSNETSAAGDATPPKSLRSAIISILVTDVTMSLDNVLAVAGAAHGYPGMLIFGGLALSIALMAVAANLVASLLERHRWLAYLGVAVVAYVALDMIWRGTSEVMNATAGG